MHCAIKSPIQDDNKSLRTGSLIAPYLFSGKAMTARDVTGFCAFVSARKSGNFLHIWGDFLSKLHRKLEKKGKNPLEKVPKNPVERRPEMQISVP